MLRWLTVVLWMGLVFVLSSIPAFPLLGVPFSDVLVRKMALIGAYAVLTALLWWALQRYTGRTTKVWSLAALVAGLYACAHIWHQGWMPGWQGSFRDVGVAALGIVGSYVLAQRGHFERSAAQRVRQCPRCQGERLYWSRRRGPIDRLGRLIFLYPLRCDICDHRFRRITRHRR
jgi:VanZ family protein